PWSAVKSLTAPQGIRVRLDGAWVPKPVYAGMDGEWVVPTSIKGRSGGAWGEASSGGAMAVQKSTRPDISESTPACLARAGARAVREATDKSFDIGIGGVGFNLRANGAHPYMREADQVRKGQFDASDSAGEQSLGTWWRLSQNDWSMGEGAEWYEPAVV